MRATPILKSIVPPVLWHIGSTLKRRLVRSTTFFEYATKGWDTPLPEHTGTNEFWNAFIAQEVAACEGLIARVKAGEALLDTDGDPKHAVFGYVLALASRQRQSLSVLDYGGNVGDYYWLARALLPDVHLDYHCKELPSSVEAGRRVTPNVTWHTDDHCFTATYDVVLFSGSLQYLRNWRETVTRGAASAAKYLLLADVPTVRDVPSYVAIHRSRGHACLEHQMNRGEVINTVERAGMRLVREFSMGGHPPIANAPEQPAPVGWLFERA